MFSSSCDLALAVNVNGEDYAANEAGALIAALIASSCRSTVCVQKGEIDSEELEEREIKSRAWDSSKLETRMQFATYPAF